jgi:hypothetical protein
VSPHRQPGALQHAGRQQLGQGAGVAAVGLGLGVRDGVQLTGAGHHDVCHVGFDDARGGERVAGRLERDLVVGCEAGGEDLKLGRPRSYATRRAQLTALADRHLAEVAVNIDANRSHGALSLPRDHGGAQAGESTPTDSCSKHTRVQSQGRPQTRPGSKPTAIAAYPSCVLPESP